MTKVPFNIFIHPANIIFFIFLILSIIIISSSNSWFIIWLCLEINILIFIPLIFKKSSKYQSEVAVKYFIIQAIASIIILIRISNLFLESINIIILTLALLLKVAAAPLHRWIPSLVEGLSWQNFFLLITTQKIAPLLILSINTQYYNILVIFCIFIISSAFIGRIRGLSQSSLRKILTYSSISHLRWILTALLINKRLWFSYFFIYSIITLSIIITLKKYNINKLSKIFKNENKNNNNIIFNFLSLGGLPPFSGFFPKLIVITKISPLPLKILLFPLIMGSLIRLFFYLRISINSIFFSIRKPNNIIYPAKKEINRASFLNILGLLSCLILFIEILDFKLKKL